MGAMGGQPPAFGAPPADAPPPAFGAPPPQQSFGGGQGVNPLGGTMAADPGAYGGGGGGGAPFGAPPPASPYGAPPGGGGGAGGGGFGAPPGGDPGFGSPPGGGGYGAPGGGGGGGFGAPPGGGAGYGGPPDPGFGAPPAGQGYGAPQDYAAQQGYGGMQPAYGGGAMVAGAGGGPIVAGQHGPKGQVRNGVMVLLYGLASCGIYQMIWWLAVANEMKAYLQRDEPNGMKILGLSLVTCGIYYLYYAATTCGLQIQEMQQRAGIANPTNPGIMLLIPYYNVILIQEELNKVWQAPG